MCFWWGLAISCPFSLLTPALQKLMAVLRFPHPWCQGPNRHLIFHLQLGRSRKCSNSPAFIKPESWGLPPTLRNQRTSWKVWVEAGQNFTFPHPRYGQSAGENWSPRPNGCNEIDHRRASQHSTVLLPHLVSVGLNGELSICPHQAPTSWDM